MDPLAARRARRKALEADLARAYTDEEACPPEWVDLLADVRDRRAGLVRLIDEEVRRFVSDPDIRRALARRERVDLEVRAAAAALNTIVGRLNLIVPHPRFGQAPIDPDELLRPLWRAVRVARAFPGPSQPPA